MLGGGKQPVRKERMYDLRAGRTRPPTRRARSREAQKKKNGGAETHGAATRQSAHQCPAPRSPVRPPDNPNRPTESEEGGSGRCARRGPQQVEAAEHGARAESRRTCPSESAHQFTPRLRATRITRGLRWSDPIAPISLAGTKPGPEKRLHKRKQKDYRTQDRRRNKSGNNAKSTQKRWKRLSPKTHRARDRFTQKRLNALVGRRESTHGLENQKG